MAYKSHRDNDAPTPPTFLPSVEITDLGRKVHQDVLDDALMQQVIMLQL